VNSSCELKGFVIQLLCTVDRSNSNGGKYPKYHSSFTKTIMSMASSNEKVTSQPQTELDIAYNSFQKDSFDSVKRFQSSLAPRVTHGSIINLP